VLDTPAAVLATVLVSAFGLMFWLVRWIVRTQRTTYDERVGELRAHNAETVDLLKAQIETGKTYAAALLKIEDGQEATRRLVEAMTERVRNAA
jgi:hypothetical protein